MIARRPHGPVPVPDIIVSLAAGDPIEAVWRNELGGITYRVAADRFVKWAPADSGLDLLAEADRMTWASRYTRVPRPLGGGQDETGSWLMTAAVPGDSAVDERWRAEPATAVAAVGHGLHHLHSVLSVDTCPFSWSAKDRLAIVQARAAAGQLDPTSWAPEHRHLELPEALKMLTDIPPTDGPVVCHGDACAPNTLVTADGAFSGHVDLGDLGVADRWADLAVATWSTQWNYGPGWEACLLDAYGISADDHRIRYYRLLWDLSP